MIKLIDILSEEISSLKKGVTTEQVLQAASNAANWNINNLKLDSPVGPRTVTSPWGEGVRDLNGDGIMEDHWGVDLNTPDNTPILCPKDGKVVIAEFTSKKCGGELKVEHWGGLFHTRYCHVKDFNGVNVGDSVSEGEIIGFTGGVSGDTGAGNSTGPHLHLEIYINGVNSDPEKYFDFGNGVTRRTGINIPRKDRVSYPESNVNFNSVNFTLDDIINGNNVLRPGSEGDVVTEIQTMLKDLGYSVEITGQLDRTTERAIIYFKRHRGISNEDLSNVDSETAKILRDESN